MESLPGWIGQLYDQIKLEIDGQIGVEKKENFEVTEIMTQARRSSEVLPYENVQ